MTATTTSSWPSLGTFQSIATMVGVAAIHASMVAANRRKKTAETEAKTKAVGKGPAGKPSSSEEEKTETDHPTKVVVTLPGWALDFYEERKDKAYTSDDEMMQVAMELSRINCKKNTGGPFGTAIFEFDPSTKISKLFTVGVNRVVPMCNSTLHGEMTAIQFGQQKIGNFSFSSAGAESKKEYHLYTSCAPCCQCLGGVMWSGVSKLVCGATKADAEAIGFSEGPVFDPLSYDALEQAGCKVVREVLRDECNAVLQWYGSNGPIYNP